MGNKQSGNGHYKEMPTQSYINYVLKKNMNAWEKDALEEKGIEENIKKENKKHKKNRFLRKFCCCINDQELQEV